jgi:hypothetical protein
MKRKPFFAPEAIARVSNLRFRLKESFCSPLKRFPRLAFLTMILLIAFSAVLRFSTHAPVASPNASFSRDTASAHLSGLPQAASALAQVMELQAALAEISTQDTLSALDSIKIEKLLGRISQVQKQIQKP